MEEVHEKYHELILRLNNNLKKNIDTSSVELTKTELSKLSWPVSDVKEKGGYLRNL